MKKTVNFVMTDPNQGGKLAELWMQIIMEKLCSCWR